MWPTIMLIMQISVGSRKLLRPTVLGVFSVLLQSPIICTQFLSMYFEEKYNILNNKTYL